MIIWYLSIADLMITLMAYHFITYTLIIVVFLGNRIYLII